MAKRKTQSDTLKKRAILTALEKSLGIVTQACRVVDVSRSTFYKWYGEDKAFADEVDSMDEMAVDFAESSLHRQIQNEVPSSTIFYLKTKGKKRGYVERQEVVTQDFPPIEFIDHAPNSEDESTKGKPKKR